MHNIYLYVTPIAHYGLHLTPAVLELLGGGCRDFLQLYLSSSLAL